MEIKKVDIAIIGGGPAGLSAALYAARGGASTVVFEKMSAGGQAALTLHIDNYPGFKRIDGYEIGLKMAEQAESAGASVVYDEVVRTELSAKEKVIYLEGKEYRAKSVIIATGASPKKLGIEGEKRFIGRGVSYCATCDGSFYKGKSVAVCGGGNTAVEDALYLADLAEKVYLIHRRDEFRADKAESDKLFKNKNIDLVLNSTVGSLEGKEGVERICVNTKDGKKSFEVAALFVAIGSDPNSALFKGQVDCDENGRIIVDRNQCTSVSGVFAAGDVTDTTLRQVITAAADGAKAANGALKTLRN